MPAQKNLPVGVSISEISEIIFLIAVIPAQAGIQKIET